MLLYATVPGFYAEVERALDPALASRPVIVGGDPRKRGSVQAATPDAVAAGVTEGMPVLEALERCPHARAIRTNMRRYREASSQLRAVFRRFSERVEPAGLEAAYLDPRSDDPELVARRLQAAVAEEHAWPLRVGIAPVKFVARLAAEGAAPGDIQRVEREGLRDFLDPLPVESLPGVGPKTAQSLRALGAGTVGALRALEPSAVE
ncbi:MAG: DNA polymerase IV, partial [Myxococcota bacterium]|nr:DNA polymerase IV [Myxococcota bacterium]